MKKIKEWFRKKIVLIKRNPNYIPLAMICVSCIVFNLKLTSYSNTIALINEPGMGFCSFVMVLCSFLSIIAFLSSFPRHEKPRIGSIIIVNIMLIISIVCQFIFRNFIIYGTEVKENPIIINEEREFVNICKSMCITHSILLIISLLLILFLPLYSKLLMKINTSITIDDNKIDEIDISDEL